MKALPVRRLSGILGLVARALRDNFGLTRLAVGGSSAPALLDHLFNGGALRMRDFDLIAIADRQVDEELVRRIGTTLDCPELHYMPKYIYPRMRARAYGEMWSAGWGAIWDARGMEVDLSIFHDNSALALNGLMNIDRILIPFTAETSLNEIAAQMLTAGTAEAAFASGLFIDPSDGYCSWIHRSPSIVAWNAVHAAPIESVIRIVRSCANKLHLNRLPANIADPLRTALLFSHERGDRFVRVRNLVKLFHDERAGAELEMMHDLGAFVRWLPEIGEVIEKLGHGGLIATLAHAVREGREDLHHHTAFAQAGEQGGDELSALRIEALLLTMAEKKRERVLAEIAVAEPLFASLIRSQLPRLVRRAPRAQRQSRQRLRA